MRLVLDTNVLLSALLWRGTPYQLFWAVRDLEETRLISSPFLIEELADVLTRPYPAKRLAAIGETAAKVLADFVEVVEVVHPAQVPRVVSGDPDDDHVLACALAGNADLIVTGDKHLHGLSGSYRGIAILNAAQALQRVTSSGK